MYIGHLMETKVNYDTPLYSISVAAKILGISVHTLRMYEKEGLIIPFKKKSSHRLYSQYDIDRLICIRKAINESKISINGIKTVYSFIPCWEIIGCGEIDRDNCNAYTKNSSPCWSYKHINNPCSSIECRNCKVYRNFSECNSIKSSIIQLLKDK